MRRRKNNDLPKILGLSAAVAVCAVGLGYAAFQSAGMQTADHYGCFEQEDAPQTLIFVDASEPRWSEAQQRSMQAYFDTLYDGLEFHERMKIFTTEGDRVTTGVPKPSFHVCGQAKKSDELKSINATGGSDGYLLKQKRRLHEDVLKPELDAMLTLEPDSARRQQYQSPIMEMVQALSREINAGDRLVVISDMIQNSDSMKACRVKNDLPPFHIYKTRSVYKNRLAPQPMTGVSVEVLMLQRAGYGQGQLAHCREDELLKFWEDYFVDNGAADFNLIRVRQGYAALAQ